MLDIIIVREKTWAQTYFNKHIRKIISKVWANLGEKYMNLFLFKATPLLLEMPHKSAMAF